MFTLVKMFYDSSEAGIQGTGKMNPRGKTSDHYARYQNECFFGQQEANSISYERKGSTSWGGREGLAGGEKNSLIPAGTDESEKTNGKRIEYETGDRGLKRDRDNN